MDWFLRVTHSCSNMSDKADETTAGSARTDLAAACRLMALFGWTDLGSTQLSMRCGDTILASPDRTWLGVVTESDLIEVSAAEGTSGWPEALRMHASVYVTRVDVGAIIHMHTREAIALSSLNTRPSLDLSLHSALVHRDVSLLDVTLNDSVETSVGEALGSQNILLQAFHGATVVGRTIQSAFARTHLFQRALELESLHYKLGGQLRSLPERVSREIAGRSEDVIFEHGSAVWPSLLRLVEGRRTP